MGMILGFSQKAILDHDHDLGKWWFWTMIWEMGSKIHGHDLKLP